MMKLPYHGRRRQTMIEIYNIWQKMDYEYIVKYDETTMPL
jgi:hypothetical protein